MADARALERARRAFERTAWADTYRLLHSAERAGPLEPEDVDRLATRYASATEVFGKDLGANHAFVAKVGEHLQSLFDVGARETVRRYLSAAQGGQ